MKDLIYEVGICAFMDHMHDNKVNTCAPLLAAECAGSSPYPGACGPSPPETSLPGSSGSVLDFQFLVYYFLPFAFRWEK